MPQPFRRSIKWNQDAEDVINYFKDDIKEDFGTLGNFFDAAVKMAIKTQYKNRIPVFMLAKLEYSSIEYFRYRDKQRAIHAENSRNWKRVMRNKLAEKRLEEQSSGRTELV